MELKFKRGDRILITDPTSLNYREHGTFDYYDMLNPRRCHIHLDKDGDASGWCYEECQLGHLLEPKQSVCDYMDAHEYAMEKVLGSCTFNIKDFEELVKKENNEMELLNIYFDKKQKEVKEKYKEKDIKIKSKDPVYKELSDIAKKYNGVRGVVCYAGCDFEFSDEIKKAIIKNDRDCDAQLDANYELKAEIIAQLEMCETYEQKMNILKAYGVVNENGILNI